MFKVSDDSMDLSLCNLIYYTCQKYILRLSLIFYLFIQVYYTYFN